MSNIFLREKLCQLFASPPSVFIEHILGKRFSNSILTADVSEYIERHQKILMQAKHFVIDTDGIDVELGLSVMKNFVANRCHSVWF